MLEVPAMFIELADAQIAATPEYLCKVVDGLLRD